MINPDRIRSVHDQVDQVYQSLAGADVSLESDPTRRPWLAGLLSCVLVGAGQIYNRQYARGLWLLLLTYGLGGLLALTYLVLSLILYCFRDSFHSSVVFGFDAVLSSIAWVGVAGAVVWLYSIVSAVRTAVGLRSGSMVVRYSLKKQGILAAAQFVPMIGSFVPSETVSRDELEKPVGGVMVDVAKDKVIEKIAKLVARYLLIGGGAVVVLIGVLAGWVWLAGLGALLLATGVILFVAG